jgi:serine/threonine protein kinase
MPRIPDTLGTLKLVRQIGTGRHCQIWEARQVGSGTAVAVKVVVPEMATDPAQRQLLTHELKVAKSLDHPTVIRIDRLVADAGPPHLVMELFPHDNLKKQIAAGVEALAPKLQRIVTEIALALDHMHGRGWVHRDLKPDNVLVAPDGQVKLIDLAIAAKSAGMLGLFGAKPPAQGTPSYMSPEQIRGQSLTPRSDVYSFGCLLFELLTGKPPYTGANANDLLNKHVSAPIPAVEAANRNVTTSAADYMRRLLAKKPGDRPASMKQVLQHLRTIRLLEKATG